ncbi:hypothetical protein [Bifidobacterium simiarum]|uniref:hypothetical protein n=1 Tax=Bifidobacterium simiarum TaxID=2045441 RepID=UPI0010565A21|nr:hypothetical protein [Bifidobacterium simiarum]
MQPSAQVSRLDDARIAEVRRLRRAAIRRRQILVASLFGVAVLVLVLALALHFSAAFALIPLALDVAVLALGARASRQARDWEAKVAKAKRASRHRRQREAQQARQAAQAQGSQSVEAQSVVSQTDTATDAMSKAEIERTIARAKAEKQAALAMRRMQRMAAEAARADAAMPTDQPEAVPPRKVRRHHVDTTASAVPQSQPASQSQPTPSVAAPQSQAVPVQPVQSAPVAQSQTVQSQSAQPTQSQTVAPQAAVSPQTVTPQSETTRSRAESAAEAEDSTAELRKVTRSHALDAFELAASQDLISFSLGAPRQGQEVRAAEPQSLEIKSTKQVAHAEPKAGDAVAAKPNGETRSATGATASETTAAGNPSAARTSSDAGRREPVRELAPDEKPTVPSRDTTMNSIISAKKAERSAQAKAEARAREAVRDAVAAPARSSDSLGGDVDAVLARRRG